MLKSYQHDLNLAPTPTANVQYKNKTLLITFHKQFWQLLFKCSIKNDVVVYFKHVIFA